MRFRSVASGSRPSGSQRARAAVIAGLIAPHLAVAQPAGDQEPAGDAGEDPAADPRDVFGFTREPESAAASCADGRTLGCVTATDPLDPVSPALLRTWLPADYLLALPVGDARQFDVAHFATGANRDGAGPAFGGATGLENVWTIEGAPVENMRNGNLETRVPLPFMAGMLVAAGGFSARDRVGLGGSIDVELVRGGDDHEVHAYVWGGLTEAPRERPIAPGSYQLRRIALEPAGEASLATVATGPLGEVAGGRAWYAAGLAAAFARSRFEWRAARLVDADGDGLPDGLPGQVVLEPIADTSTTTLDYLVPVMSRAGWARGPHDITLTLLGNASQSALYLANATEQAAGVDRDTFVGDAIATWKGSWRNRRARVQLAWHRSDRREHARDAAAAGIPQRLTAYIPEVLPDDPRLAAACSDTTNDPYPTIPNCPIPFGFFASGGAGLLVDSVGDRPTITADLAQRLGGHVVRAGGTFEDNRLVTTSRFTGGERVRSLFEDHADRERFIAGECSEDPAGPCAYASEAELTYRTRYTAAYVEDTFSPARDIRVDTGVRWELMWVGPRLHFSDQISPRLSIAWDVLGDGRSRWWASMGRTHAILPAGLGPVAIAREATVRDVELGEVRDRRIDGGGVYRIAEDLRPAMQDEVTTGLELGLAGSIRGGAWIQRRSLRRGLENVLAVPATGEAFIANPGAVGPFTTSALRESLLVAAEVLIAPSPALSVRASYLWGEVAGTWTGPFDPRQGATLYAGTDWDLDATNLYGRLPSDPGHRVALEAVRRGKLAGIAYAVSTRLVVASGRPRDVLADSDLGVIQLLPRGAGGRYPMRSRADVRLAAQLAGFDVTLDVFDTFDRRAAVAASEVYAGQQVHPVTGGSYEDLVFLKSESCGESGCTATPPQRRTAYGLPFQFQRPRGFVLGVRRSF